MNNNTAIKIQEVSKKFNIKSNFPNSIKEYYALNNINLEIKKGEKIGIIGRNGAGKSTLLKIISKIILPTTGFITIFGKINSLLEVGIGFVPELSGRENIYLNSSLLGLTKNEINNIINDIIDFSELNQFIDIPVKNLSSGMYSRLAFSVGINIPGDILAIDEVLSVGDLVYREKALIKMNEVMLNKNKTIIFVSHNINSLKKFCDRIIWLDNGIVKLDGNTNVVLDSYLSFVRNGTINSIKDNTLFIKDPDYKFISFKLKNCNNIYKSSFGWSEDIILELIIEVINPSLTAYKGFHLFCSPRNGVVNDTQVFAQISEDSLPLIKGKYFFSVKIPKKMLASGNYYLTLFIFSKEKPIIRHQMLEKVLSFSIIHDLNTVLDGDTYYGVINPVLEWRSLKV